MSSGRHKPRFAQVLGALMLGKSPKEASLDHGTHRTFANKVAKRAGLEPMYLSAAERSAVLTMRARLTPQTSLRA
jgi:hypothetical protein